MRVAEGRVSAGEVMGKDFEVSAWAQEERTQLTTSARVLENGVRVTA
jgi:hypothetical protein